MKVCREILLPLHLLLWDLGPLLFQYVISYGWQKCRVSSPPKQLCLLIGWQQREKKYTGRWIDLFGPAYLCSASSWGSDKATHYFSAVLTVHVCLCHVKMKRGSVRISWNVLICKSIWKILYIWDNVDHSNARILPAEGIFFTSRITCLYWESLLQKELDLKLKAGHSDSLSLLTWMGGPQ